MTDRHTVDSLTSDELDQLYTERDRYRLAWQSARFRAEARGEGIERLCGDRDSYKSWLEQEQRHSAGLRAALDQAQQPTTTEADSCARHAVLTAAIGYPVRCPHCDPTSAPIPATHWTKHLIRHHPEQPTA